MLRLKRLPSAKALFWIYLLLILLLKLTLTTGFRVWAFVANQYDDGMMLSDAANLISFHWLGPYTEYVLAKGVTFPAYLMLINKLGLPFLLSIVLLSFAACVTFVLSVRPIIRSRLLLAVLYTVLMLNPMATYYWTFNRVYRDTLYSYLVLFLFSFIIALFLNREGPLRRTLLCGVGGGLSLAAVWLAREDSPWVLPFTVVALAVLVFSILRNKAIGKKAKRLLAVALVAVIPALCVLGVSAINAHYYGVFMTNEFTGGSLPRLVKDLQSIQPDVWMPRVPIPKSTREKAYAVSPTFAKIRPVLENHAFISRGNGNPTCDMFVWGLVNSVQWAGMDDGRSSQEFYRKSAEEIEAAAKAGKLKTRGGYLSVFESPWDSRYIPSLIESVRASLRMTVTMTGTGNTTIPATNIAAQGNDTQIRNLEQVTNNLAYYPAETVPGRQKKVDFFNRIDALYTKCNPAVTVLGLLCTLYLLARLLLSIRSKKYRHLDAVLIIAGLYLSYLLRLLLISYSNVSCNFMLYPMYLAPAYWLLLMAGWSAILLAVQDLLDLVHRRVGKKRPPAAAAPAKA